VAADPALNALDELRGLLREWGDSDDSR
jgi:hypothetical protein